jgi:hypothetical protein
MPARAVFPLLSARWPSKLIRPRPRMVVHTQDFEVSKMHTIRRKIGRIGNHQLSGSGDATGMPKVKFLRKKSVDRGPDLPRHPSSRIRTASIFIDAQRAKVLQREPRPLNAHGFLSASVSVVQGHFPKTIARLPPRRPEWFPRDRLPRSQL